MSSPNPGVPGNNQFDGRAQNLANPDSNLLKWVGPQVISALLPLAKSMVLKLALRWATTGSIALIALAEHTGVSVDVGDSTKITAAVVLLVSLGVDALVSLISSKLKPIPKALPVDQDI